MNPVCARALSEFRNVCSPDCVIVHGTTYNVRHLDHPGGRVFVRLAGSMDITELFETSHVNIARARAALKRLPIVAHSGHERTHHVYTAYEQLRACVFRLMPTRESRAQSTGDRRRLRAWIALCGALHGSVLWCHEWSLHWLVCCLLSAACNTIVGAYGHNGVHRLHPSALGLDWNGLSSFEWISEHVVSHHPFVNTIRDHDALSIEPVLAWLPSRDGCFGMAQTSPLRHAVWALSEIIVSIQGICVHATRWKAIRYESPWWMTCGPLLFLIRVTSHVLTQTPGLAVASLLATMAPAGYVFATLAHMSHEFVTTRQPCLLSHQLRNTRDIEPFGARHEWSLFLDRQCAHHLFPSVDHGRWTPQLVYAIRQLGHHHA